VDVLCVDKTGTITEPGMEVEQVIPLTADPPERLEDVLAALYSGTEPENDTARAMTEMFAGETDWVCERRIPFTSENKWSAAIFRGQGAFVVGAPEFVMKARYGEIQEAVEEWSKKGSRVLLIAAHAGTLAEHLEVGKLRPLALVVLSNKIRAAAPQTFAYFKEQGVTIKVISGDNPLTVSQVALRAGIEGAENYVDASTLETEEAIAKAAATCTVFGRVTPDKKKALLRALKAAGHTVAMTGDGVNDVLALKEANCSIAMASGSQAASQVAQLVLTESDFAAMPAIVGEGRRVINNIQRSASLFLVKNILSMGLALACLIAGFPYPFVPLHLTLISALTIGFPSFCLAMEPNYERVSGKFLPTVLGKALPGGLAGLVMVLLAQLILVQLGIPASQISTACAAIIATVGMFVLRQTCKPFDLFRHILWWAMAVALVFCFTILSGFFDLTHGGLNWTLVMFSLMAAAPVVYKLLRHGLEWLGKRLKAKA
jgi:cation-transporting ATPase E